MTICALTDRGSVRCAIRQTGAASGARAMGATEDAISFFHVMADDSATAMGAFRRQRVDRAFKAVEDMLLSSQNYFKRFVVIISADFTLSHANDS
jgi:hypothetical protein